MEPDEKNLGIMKNWISVREKISTAARHAGRDPGKIKIVAVTKTHPVEQIRKAIEVGLTTFGENRVQEMAAKQPLLPENLEWHLIGHLQTNKVKYIIGKVHLIHSLDSWRLANEISRWALKKNVRVNVLVQVNIAGESTKYGLIPGEVADFISEIGGLQGLNVCGLMTVAPEVSDPEEVRFVFRELRLLAEGLQGMQSVSMDYLSMGMSNDYVVAVEEGSNMLRLGTAVFGNRKNKKEE